MLFVAQATQEAAHALPAPPVALPVSTLALYAAALVVLVVAALTTTRPFIRLLRNPMVAAYVGAGWVWLAFGAVIGPHGFDVLSDGMIDSLRPLLLIALGWVGLTVGLQLNAPLMRAVPRVVWRWALVDSIVCVAVACGALVAIAPYWLAVDTTTSAWVVMPIAILGASLLGWNPESRSMLARSAASDRTLAQLASGTAGLAGIFAVLAFGVMSQLVVRDSMGTPVVSWTLCLTALGAAAGLAVCAAVAIRVLLHRGDWSTSRTLIVVMSIAALAAGIAAELNFSPLLATLLCGVALANIPGRLKLSVWRLLSRSERAVATGFFILAGALLTAPLNGWWWLAALVVICVAVRIAVKPLVMRLTVGWAARTDGADVRLLRGLPARQSALAIIIGVAAVLSEDSMLRRELLMVIAFTGILSAAWSLRHRMRASRRVARHAPPGEGAR